MLDDITYSKEILYRKNFKIFIPSLLIIILSSVVIYLIFFTEKYDVVTSRGVISCSDTCSISLMTLAENIETLKKAEIIILDDKEYKIKNITLSNIETDYEARESYQTITYELVKKVNFNNEIVSINILSNKTRLINKINPFKKGG